VPATAHGCTGQHGADVVGDAPLETPGRVTSTDSDRPQWNARPESHWTRCVENPLTMATSNSRVATRVASNPAVYLVHDLGRTLQAPQALGVLPAGVLGAQRVIVLVVAVNTCST
jgi:hypothetical protein